MRTITCPVDHLPCEQDCPDRYTNREEGGCLMTTLLEHGHTALMIAPDTDSKGGKMKHMAKNYSAKRLMAKCQTSRLQLKSIECTGLPRKRIMPPVTSTLARQNDAHQP